MKDQSITFGNINVDIFYDDFPQNPRMDSNQTQFVMFHKGFDLPNESNIPNYKDFFNSWNEMQLDLQSNFKHVTSVYMLNHGDVYFSLSPFMDEWDSGKIGFIVSNEGTLEEFQRNAKAELITYGYYARGECYGFTVSNSEEKESIFGFYGTDFLENGLIDSLNSILEENFELSKNQIFQIIKSLN